MFARRITIVSLMALVFALSMARIVAEAGRERQMRGDGVSCPTNVSLRCLAR